MLHACCLALSHVYDPRCAPGSVWLSGMMGKMWDAARRDLG